MNLIENIIEYLSQKEFIETKKNMYNKGIYDIFIANKTLVCWKNFATYFSIPINKNTIQILDILFTDM